MKTAAIVGAGIGGIATALRLAKRGFAIDVYEAADGPGGKLREFRTKGFRFDAGPSLFTLPHLVEELHALQGNDVPFPFEKLDRSCHYFWDDGTHFTAWADKNKLAAEIEDSFGVSPGPTLKHLEYSDLLYDRTSSLFMERSLHRTKSYLSKDVLRALVKVHKLSLNSTMNAVNEKRLNHPKLVQLFNRYATYNGSDPYRAPGVLSIIPHLEHNIGTFFPKKGMYQITQSLVEAAEKLGVNFHYNAKVERIIVQGKKAAGLVVDGKETNADFIVSNADVYPTFRKLLKDQPAPEAVLARERSSSALIFYWGVARIFPELHLHNILFSNDYEDEFKLLFEGERISEDPTVYINITSKCAPEDAPKGKENWFVMINVPSNSGQSWERLIPLARKHIIRKINKALKTDIEPFIIAEERLDPITIESKTSSYMGSLYGTSSNDKMAAFLRHPNFAKKIKSLYFCGGSVHPGGGIPLCLLSAKIVDELIAQDHA
ncbi:MAG: phytoene desaturase family protein [Flavobacteriales bacterium]|nr:phytoene desaturase family protein [Flavobacteriales bacterium]